MNESIAVRQIHRLAGDALVTLACGSWDLLGEAARAVRLAVFVHEQGIPESEEWDEDDALAWHAVVHNVAAGAPIATGRLLHTGRLPGHVKLGRMAVLRNSRGMGVGRLVLRALLLQAKALRATQVSLHAQASAMPFYAAEGFVPQGDVFDEVGIPHQAMTLKF